MIWDWFATSPGAFQSAIYPIRNQEAALSLWIRQKVAQQVAGPTCFRRDAPEPAEPAAAGGKPGWCNRQKAGEGTASPGQLFTVHPLWEGGGDHTDGTKYKSQEWDLKKKNWSVKINNKRTAGTCSQRCLLQKSKLGCGGFCWCKLLEKENAEEINDQWTCWSQKKQPQVLSCIIITWRLKENFLKQAISA